jgi:hypothetical protein
MCTSPENLHGSGERQTAFAASTQVTILSYATPKPRLNHDKIYTRCLGVVIIWTGFFIVVCGQNILNGEEPRASLWLMIWINVVYLVAEVSVMSVRVRFSAYRKWPTLALNLLLFPYAPFGTILSIYGLLKADRARTD